MQEIRSLDGPFRGTNRAVHFMGKIHQQLLTTEMYYFDISLFVSV
jgi:hypothetical protein